MWLNLWSKKKLIFDSSFVKMTLHRRSKLDSSFERRKTSTATSPSLLNRSLSYSPSANRSPNSLNQSKNSNILEESISEDETNQNLTDDSSSRDSADEEACIKKPVLEVCLSPNRNPVGKPVSPKSNSKFTGSSKTSAYLKPFLLFIAFLVVMCPIIWFMLFMSQYSSADNSSLISRETADIALLKEIKSLQNLYPHQSKKTWIEFMAAITSIIEDPPQPAVLLLLTSNSDLSVKTSKCMANNLAVIINRFFNASSNLPVQVKNQVYSSRHDEDKIKEDLDREIRAILANSFAIILENIENIPPKAAMVLHGYCDNFMACFKQRVIILTAVVSDESLLDFRKVDNYLHGLWDSALGIDKAAALVSRIANMPVLIQPEKLSVPCEIV